MPIGALIGALAGQFIPQKIMMSAGAQALTSTALSGLGTMYDNRQAEIKARRKQGNFYVDLRNAAQRAGLNPLTVLRSGTAGAYADAGYAPALTSNAFTNMFNDMRETNARISNMKAQESNMLHGQQMDKLNYELRKAEYQFNQGLASTSLVDKVNSNLPLEPNYEKLTTNSEGEVVGQPEPQLYTHVGPSGNTYQRPYAPDADMSEILAGYMKLADSYAVDATRYMKRNIDSYLTSGVHPFKAPQPNVRVYVPQMTQFGKFLR